MGRTERQLSSKTPYKDTLVRFKLWSGGLHYYSNHWAIGAHQIINDNLGSLTNIWFNSLKWFYLRFKNPSLQWKYNFLWHDKEWFINTYMRNCNKNTFPVFEWMIGIVNKYVVCYISFSAIPGRCMIICYKYYNCYSEKIKLAMNLFSNCALHRLTAVPNNV